MSLTNERAAVLADQHFAALAAGDAALAARCIHPAHVNHMAADEPPACTTPGVAGFLATSAWLRLAFSDLSFEIIELTADADRTMAHVRLTGRQTGPFVVFPPGARPAVFAPTGRAFGVRQVHVFRHRAGRHGEHIAVRDDLSMMTQLGHLPPSPKVAWRMAPYRADRLPRPRGSRGYPGQRRRGGWGGRSRAVTSFVTHGAMPRASPLPAPHQACRAAGLRRGLAGPRTSPWCCGRARRRPSPAVS